MTWRTAKKKRKSLGLPKQDGPRVFVFLPSSSGDFITQQFRNLCEEALIKKIPCASVISSRKQCRAASKINSGKYKTVYRCEYKYACI